MDYNGIMEESKKGLSLKRKLEWIIMKFLKSLKRVLSLRYAIMVSSMKSIFELKSFTV